MAVRNTELYIIQPKEATNLVTNPSFETVTTGYTAVGASSSIARSATYQRRGTWSLEVTPTTGADSGVYFGTVALTTGTLYTFSCDVLDVAGQAMALYIATTGGVAKSTTAWTGDGYWKRKSVSWTCDSSTTYRLYLVRYSVASTAKFYTDGWQCEAGAESTYLDGDMQGFSRTRQDFGWNGTPHASTSWRSGKTRSGGTLLRVQDYARIIGDTGLGMPPVVNNSIPSSAGGAWYQNTVTQTREFSLALAFASPSGLSSLYASRSAIVNAIKMDAVPQDEPLILRWILTDTDGDQASEPLDLACLYKGGLEYDASDPNISQYLERALVNFEAFQPMFVGDGQTGADLSLNQTIANSAYLLYKSPTAGWVSMGAVNGIIYDLKIDLTGNVWVTGNFTSIGGVSANRIAYWNGSSWNACGSGLSATGNVIGIAPDNTIYVGGNFSTANGVTVNYIARWTGSTFAAMGTTGMNGNVRTIAFDDAGYLYAGGAFTTAGGGAANYIAKWSGSAWSALGSGLGGYVDRITTSGVAVYASHQSTGYVSKWNGSAWASLGLVPSVGPYVASALFFGRDGNLYTAGAQLSGSNYASAFYYTGGGWKTWNIGVSTAADTIVAAVTQTGPNTYLVGGDLTYGYSTLPSYDTPCVIEYRNGTVLNLDIKVPSTTYQYPYAIVPTANGGLWLAGSWTTNAVAAANTTVSVSANKAYPVIRFTGPGSIYQITNYTTGKTIWFNGLILQAGETALLDLRPGNVRFNSDWRGNLLKFVKPGSDFDFYLMPGANSLSCFSVGTTAASKAYLSVQGQYWSIDGAAR